MKQMLEKAKELVKMLQAAVDEEQQVQLSTLKPRDKFTTDIGEFIVLEQLEGQTKVITAKLFKENVRFDDSSTDYKKSELKKLCDTEILQEFEKAFGADNIVEHTADLTTLDGQKTFGTVVCKVRPLTFDEVRKYTEILSDKELSDWYWTCTAWSTKERGWEYSVAVARPSGSVINDIYDYHRGVRPFCILKSNIFVSKGE